MTSLMPTPSAHAYSYQQQPPKRVALDSTENLGEEPRVTRSHEKRQLIAALMSLEDRTLVECRMAVILWDVNGIGCALSFVECLTRSRNRESSLLDRPLGVRTTVG